MPKNNNANKTNVSDTDVGEFLNTIEDEKRREDCQRVVDLMAKVTGWVPKVWGTNMIGFGSYHYTYASGRQGDWFMTGVAPRKQALSIYIMNGFEPYEELMAKLGKHKTGKSCLYIKKIEDIDEVILEEMVKLSVARMQEKYGVHFE